MLLTLAAFRPVCPPQRLYASAMCLPSGTTLSNSLSLQVGEEFNRISLGLCNEATLPYLLQAAPFAGVDILRFQKAMQDTMRDKKQVSLTFQLLTRGSV